jgi:membrane protein insertase Oxa1/YidC/SpoIIIJ
LEHLFVAPLMVLYESVYFALVSLAGSLGFGLVLFSLVLNLALLPVYLQMERASRAAVALRAKMDEEVKRMKRHFRGRERYFYVRTVHRQFGYHPISAVLSSGELYLQVLIFATVFQYLSNVPELMGASFMGIPDLSQPDALLFGVNVLPIVMTVANVVSAIFYGSDKKRRRQAFALAGLFLVLLYSSPSGLVLYWACNNIVSLLRNVTARFAPALVPQKWARAARSLAMQE